MNCISGMEETIYLIICLLTLRFILLLPGTVELSWFSDWYHSFCHLGAFRICCSGGRAYVVFICDGSRDGVNLGRIFRCYHIFIGYTIKCKLLLVISITYVLKITLIGKFVFFLTIYLYLFNLDTWQIFLNTLDDKLFFWISN